MKVEKVRIFNYKDKGELTVFLDEDKEKWYCIDDIGNILNMTEEEQNKLFEDVEESSIKKVESVHRVTRIKTAPFVVPVEELYVKQFDLLKVLYEKIKDDELTKWVLEISDKMMNGEKRVKILNNLGGNKDEK